MREVLGADVKLYVDAHCGLDLFHATDLARRIEPHNIGFFEVPLTQNDVRQMAALRGRTTIPLACGQNEGLAFRFRDLLIQQAADVLQPNVVISGAYSQCVRIAAMAQAFNVPIDNGGAWPIHNMHLHAGVSIGGMVEYHYVAVQPLKQIYDHLPEPLNGWLTLPDKPGLGFAPNAERVRELAKLPLSRGKGKA